MALRQSYTTQADIPEILREHYIERDARWILQTDPPSDDVVGLKSALDAERKLHRDAAAKVTELTTRFDGIDPDHVRDLQSQMESFKDKQILDKDGMDALKAKLTAESQRQLATKDREIGVLRTQTAELDAKWRRDRIHTAIIGAVTRAGVMKDAVDYAVNKGLTVFVELDENGVPLAKNGADVRYGKDGVAPLSPDEWALSLRQEAPFLWPPSHGGGAQQSPYAGNGINTIDYSKLPPAERLTRFREAQAAKR